MDVSLFYNPAVAEFRYRQFKLRGQDLNLRPRGYEPRELPGCSTPRQLLNHISDPVAVEGTTGKNWPNARDYRRWLVCGLSIRGANLASIGSS